MDKDIEKKYYTCQNLIGWLQSGQDNELSETIISRTRALALVNHPDVKPDTILLAVIFVGGKVASFTAYYPEDFEKPKLNGFGWGTTQYTYPEFRGRKLGYENIKMIKEACDYRYFALESSEASTYIDKKLGSKIIYYDRNRLQLSFSGNIFSPRGLMNCFRWMLFRLFGKRKRNALLDKVRQNKCQLEYVDYIDDNTYQFVSKHSQGDYFLRSKASFNWMLRYNMKITAPLKKKVAEHPFGAPCLDYRKLAVKVLLNGGMVGFYILRKKDNDLSLLYIYTEKGYEETVHLSIVEHVLYYKPRFFTTFDSGLAKMMTPIGTRKIEKVSFTLPVDYEIDESLRIQGGDGDMSA